MHLCISRPYRKHERSSGNERELSDQFFAALVEMGDGNYIYKMVWENFIQKILMPLEGKYVFSRSRGAT